MNTQELGRQNPQLIQMIQGNQEEFLRILQEEPAEGEMVRYEEILIGYDRPGLGNSIRS